MQRRVTVDSVSTDAEMREEGRQAARVRAFAAARQGESSAAYLDEADRMGTMLCMVTISMTSRSLLHAADGRPVEWGAELADLLNGAREFGEEWVCERIVVRPTREHALLAGSIVAMQGRAAQAMWAEVLGLSK